MKHIKILKLSAIAAVLSTGLLLTGYTIVNKNITLVVKGNETEISTLKSSVKDILKEQNIKYDENDIISLPLESKVSDGNTIEVIDVTYKTIKENKEVPFEVDIIEDKDLLKGETKVEVEGQVGNNELVYEMTYHNGKQVQKKFLQEIVSKKPINKVIKKGTKVVVKKLESKTATTLSNNNSNKKKMSVVATAYSGHGITSTGTTPKWGTIAVDPKVIPYGTKVYIPKFNKTFIAEDCGGAIKGNKIDIYMNDKASAIDWGRRSIDIYIIG